MFCGALLVLSDPSPALAAPQKRSSMKGGSARRTKKKVKSSSRRKRRKKRSRRRKDRWPPMKLYHANTRERLSARLYDRKGRTDRKGVRSLYRFLRCTRSGKKRVMNWRLLKHLYTVSRKFKGKTIVVYSAYRTRKLAPGRESRHRTGRALDFRVRGVSNKTLRDYLMKRFKKVGVGYYTRVPFVHLDVRDRRAFWVDTSSSGQRSNYVDAWKYLKAERAGKSASKKKGSQKPASAAPIAANTRAKVMAKEKAKAKAPPAATATATATPTAPPTPTAAPTPRTAPARASMESPEDLVVQGPPPLGPDAIALPSLNN